MALLEINLKKPALIEERQYPPADGRMTTKTGTGTSTTKSTGSSGSSGRSTSKSVLGFLLLAVVTAVAAKAIRSRRSSSSSPSYENEDEETPIIGAEETDESGGWKRAVGGLLGVVAVVALLARTIRGRTEN